MQPFDPLGVYTTQQVIDALTGKYGVRQITYRFDRLSEQNNYLGALDYVVSGTVSNNALADIKRTAKFRILDRTSLNYLKDRVKPWATLAMPDGGKVEWPLGVFLLATPERVLAANGLLARDVTAYDQLLVLNQDKVGDRYTVAAGALYTDAIATLVFGLVTSSIVPSTLTLPAAMEWDPGTTKLRILNDLLGAINYESAWFNEAGTLICRPYQSPVDRAVEYDYSANVISVITGDVSQTLDLFDVPNKWILSKSEADVPPLTGTYTNTSPTSPTSTVSRGRTIVDFQTETDAADQTTIDAKAARAAFDASQVYENIKFQTVAMPMHSNADVLHVGLPGLAVDAKYSEHTWDLPLVTGAKMSHVVRRVVTV